MAHGELATPTTPTPRAAILSYLESHSGEKIRASVLLREAVPDFGELAALVEYLQKLDAEDLINVDRHVDAEGVAHVADPECWVD